MKLVKVKAGKYKSEDGRILIEKDQMVKRFMTPPTWRAYQLCGLNFKAIATSDSLAALKAQVSRMVAA
jgi:hypothetical protein